MKSLNPQAVKVLTALLERKERIHDNDNGKVREVQAKVAPPSDSIGLSI